MTKLNVTVLQVCEILMKEYGISVEHVQQLDGYLDKNFRVVDTSGQRFVLRLQAQQHFEELEKIADLLMEHMQSNAMKVPCPVKTLDGRKHFKAELVTENGQMLKVPVQLAIFIPGETIFNSSLNASELFFIARNVGKFGGIIQECLVNIRQQHTGFRRSDFNVWYPENFPLISRYLHLVGDVELRNIISVFIDDFKTKLIPKLTSLRKGFVHGDYSDMNIIIVDRDRLASSHDLTKQELLQSIGTIDFEYAHYGYPALDLSVCMAYMMTKAVSSQTKPLPIAAQVLRGYAEHFSLTGEELQAIFLGVVARLSSSYVMSLRTLSENEDSDEKYVTGQAAQCPGLLRLLWNSGEQRVTKEWLSTQLCNQYEILVK